MKFSRDVTVKDQVIIGIIVLIISFIAKVVIVNILDISYYKFFDAYIITISLLYALIIFGARKQEKKLYLLCLFHILSLVLMILLQF